MRPPDRSRAGRHPVAGREETARSSSMSIDNGIGLPREHRQRLLEPYVTTRDKGTGLGLAIVKEDHGGAWRTGRASRRAGGGRGRTRRDNSHRLAPLESPRTATCAVAALPSRERERLKYGVGHPHSRRRGRYPRTGCRDTGRRGSRYARRRATPTRRCPRSAAGGRPWCSWTSGCRAAASTGSPCSTRSRRTIPICRS